MRFLRWTIRWLLRLVSFGRWGKKPKSVVPLLVYPVLPDSFAFNQVQLVDKTDESGQDSYYTSEPWLVDMQKVAQAVTYAEGWLTQALGTPIRWEPVRTIQSQSSLAQWRSGKIYLIENEVKSLGLPWNENHVYLAFVRGMGGYAGGINYQNGNAGFAMVGDVCLEAICEFPQPTAGSELLQPPVWGPNAYSLAGQSGAFIHEALHGLGLPHPERWPAGEQPGMDETLMGNWWNMPNFPGTKGLTQREIDKVLEWLV